MRKASYNGGAADSVEIGRERRKEINKVVRCGLESRNSLTMTSKFSSNIVSLTN